MIWSRFWWSKLAGGRFLCECNVGFRRWMDCVDILYLVVSHFGMDKSTIVLQAAICASCATCPVSFRPSSSEHLAGTGVA